MPDDNPPESKLRVKIDFLHLRDLNSDIPSAKLAWISRYFTALSKIMAGN